MKNWLKNIIEFLDDWWFELRYGKIEKVSEPEEEKKVEKIYKNIQFSELKIKYNPGQIYHLDWSTPQEVGEEVTSPYSEFYEWYCNENSKSFIIEDKEGLTVIRRDLIIFLTIKKVIRKVVDDEATKIAIEKSLTKSKSQTKEDSESPRFVLGGRKV